MYLEDTYLEFACHATDKYAKTASVCPSVSLSVPCLCVCLPVSVHTFSPLCQSWLLTASRRLPSLFLSSLPSHAPPFLPPSLYLRFCLGLCLSHRHTLSNTFISSHLCATDFLSVSRRRFHLRPRREEGEEGKEKGENYQHHTKMRACVCGGHFHPRTQMRQTLLKLARALSLSLSSSPPPLSSRC